MNNVKFILALFFVFPTINLSFSQTSSNFRKLELSNKILSQTSSNNLEEKYNNSAQVKYNEKSPYLGALFSGIIPGTGEFYAKRYLKGAIFLAVEAGLWIAYSSFESKGNNQTESYQNYANQNWSLNKYAQWLVDESFQGFGAITDPQTSNLELLRSQVNIVEAQNFSHQLPPIGDQQYYELIGKYQNFVVGWADADKNLNNVPGSQNYYGTYTTQMYEDYSYSRQQANDYYNNATTSLTLVVLNHLLSAADGAWSVSMFNKDLKVKTGVHLENIYSSLGEKKLIPVANLNITF